MDREYNHLWRCNDCTSKWWYNSSDHNDTQPLGCPECNGHNWSYLGRNETPYDEVIACPWCFEKFDTRKEWGRAFDENHPIISRVDNMLGILNTPKDVK